MKPKLLKKNLSKKKIFTNSMPQMITKNRSLRAERDEARETLRAISSGEVDAFLVQTKDGEKIFTLKSAEHAYRVLVEAMNEGAATLLEDGTIIYCNNKFANLLHKSPNSICGEKIWDYIAKRDAQLFETIFFQSLTRSAKGDLFLSNSLGTLIDVHISLGAVDFSGTNAITMVVTDLTERKQNESLIASENLTRSILDQAAEAIIVCDSEGFITRANPETQRLIGYNPIHLPFDKAFQLKTETGEYLPLSEVKRNGRQTRGLAVSIAKQDKSITELSMSISHLESSTLGLWHVVTLTDVTPIKRMEKLKAAKEAAESANMLKTAFLANMSHEIRTPLGAIVGFAELMQESELDKDVRSRYLEIISKSGKALTILIDDILDLSKIEAGAMDMENVDLSVRELVSEMTSLFSHKTAIKGLNLLVEYAEDIPEKIKTDPLRLRQILINIIGNAVKFTQCGEIEIHVSMQSNEFNINQINFRIRDTGPGLTAEQQKRIFAAFTQGDESTTRIHGGTGLGLILSRRIARALGGDVVLESSEAGVGSVFCISAAILSTEVKAQHVVLPFPVNPSQKQSAVEKSLKNINILVVDDSLDNQTLFSSLFENRGAKVSVANNGREGVDKAKSENFDVVIMDIQMPVLDGYEATKELIKSGYKTPIIALTAYAMKEEKERCLSVGCVAHLSKPLNLNQAIETIISVVRSFRNINIESDSINDHGAPIRVGGSSY